MREVAAMRELGMLVTVLAQSAGGSDDWQQALDFGVSRDQTIYRDWRRAPHDCLTRNRRIWQAANFDAYGRSLGLRRVGYFRRLLELVEVRKATLIHCHFVQCAAEVGLGLSQVLGIPMTLIAHDGHLAEYPPTTLRKLQSDSAAVVCVSNAWRTLWSEKTGSSDRLAVVPNGIPLDSFCEFGLIDEKVGEVPTILGVGNLVPGKRFGDLIRAVGLLRQGNIELNCRIVGGGSQLNELQELSLRLGLTDRVMLLGAKSHSVVRHELSRADIFAHCSERESFGISTVEAMAAKLPVVVSRTGGAEDTVIHGVNGFTFEVGDVPTLAVHLRKLIEDAALRKQMGQRGFERARELFSWDAHMTAMASIWQQAVAPQRGNASRGVDPALARVS